MFGYSEECSVLSRRCGAGFKPSTNRVFNLQTLHLPGPQPPNPPPPWSSTSKPSTNRVFNLLTLHLPGPQPPNPQLPVFKLQTLTSLPSRPSSTFKPSLLSLPGPLQPLNPLTSLFQAGLWDLNPLSFLFQAGLWALNPLSSPVFREQKMSLLSTPASPWGGGVCVGIGSSLQSLMGPPGSCAKEKIV